MKLVNFELMRKTEEKYTVVKHGAYKFDPKYLRRIKSLNFHKKIEAADVEDFRHLSKIKDIKFYAGVQSDKILHWIGQYKFENLESMLIADWPSTSLRSLERLTSLRNLTLSTQGSLLNVDCGHIESLHLRITGYSPKVTVAPTSQLRSLSISAAERIGEIRLNENVKSFALSSIGLWLNHNPTDIDDTCDLFDLSTLANASSLQEIDIPRDWTNSSSNSFPSIEAFNSNSSGDYKMLQRTFPNINTLYTRLPSPSSLKEMTALIQFLRSSPNLKTLYCIGSIQDNRKLIEDIGKDFPDLALKHHFRDRAG